MKHTISAHGTVTNGKLHISFRDRFLSCFTTWKDCRVEVTVKKLYKRRSNQQNGYYWGVIVQTARLLISEAYGQTISNEEAHEHLKRECNYTEIVSEATGEISRLAKSTTELTTVEMEEYNERCRQWLYNFFGEVVPLPNEQGELFEEKFA